MDTLAGHREYRRAARTAMMLFLLAMMSIVPLGAVAQSGPAPTVGDAVVDSYDCDTGELNFHVPVTDLPHVNPSEANGSLGYDLLPDYEQGPDTNWMPARIFNPQAAIAPYTGNVHLTLTVPASNDVPENPGPSGPLTSVTIIADVGPDRSETIYSPDCGDSTDALIRQLIEVLNRILADLLNG